MIGMSQLGGIQPFRGLDKILSEASGVTAIGHELRSARDPQEGHDFTGCRKMTQHSNFSKFRRRNVVADTLVRSSWGCGRVVFAFSRPISSTMELMPKNHAVSRNLRLPSHTRGATIKSSGQECPLYIYVRFSRGQIRIPTAHAPLSKPWRGHLRYLLQNPPRSPVRRRVRSRPGPLPL